jgi:hypothetical protein
VPALLGRLRRRAARRLIVLSLAAAACASGPATPDAAPAIIGGCDPVGQDCPAGQKCAEARCVAAGHALLGAPCAPGDAGVDDCAAGLRCSPLGVATSPDGREPRVCRAYCDDDRDCGDGERCGGNPARPGVCLIPCALFAGDCPEGRTCEYPPTADTFSTCRATGALAVGAPCTLVEHACPADTTCAALPAGTARVCLLLCDTVERGAGQRGCPRGGCQEIFADRHVGVCAPPPADAGPFP